MDIERIPIDQYVCDSCNDAITDTDYKVYSPMQPCTTTACTAPGATNG